jgi:hypothetical protein
VCWLKVGTLVNRDTREGTIKEASKGREVSKDKEASKDKVDIIRTKVDGDIVSIIEEPLKIVLRTFLRVIY